MEIKRIIDDYLLIIKLKHAHGTYRFYRSHLNHFRLYCESMNVHLVDDVDDHLIVEYISKMKETNANVTINKNIGCLKRMYRDMNISFDFLQSLGKLKERFKTLDVLDFKTFKRIRKYVKDYPSKTVNGVFHKCFLALLSDTGARINEIMMIEKKNVNLSRHEILLTTTKTNEDRIVYLSDAIGVPAVHEMLKIKSDHKFLLHNIDKNRSANYDDIRYILKQAKEHLKIKKLHPHMFRHTLATYLIETGSDIASIMSILGHKNIKTTERYLHVSKRHVKKTYQENINKLD